MIVVPIMAFIGVLNVVIYVTTSFFNPVLNLCSSLNSTVYKLLITFGLDNP